MKYGFMKVASAIPAVKVGDVIFNTQQIEDRAAERYENFLRTREGQKILFLELGVGYNTPVIITFRRMLVMKAMTVCPVVAFTLLYKVDSPIAISLAKASRS